MKALRQCSWRKVAVVLMLLPGLLSAAAGTVAAATVSEPPPSEPAPRETVRAIADAEQVVADFHAQLLASIESVDFSLADRYQRLLPAISTAFNIPTIARLSLGRTWRTLDPGQRTEFTAALTELVAATYADRFTADAKLSFVTLASEAGRRGPLIRTHLVRQTGQPVTLDYHFRAGKIYNVVANGVSDLSLRRADYNTVVKQQGFAQLLEHVRSQQQALVGVERSANR